MSAPSRETLWTVLRQAALVEGDLPATGALPSPWYVRVMLGIAGWVGAMFLLAFVGAGLAFVIENAVVSWVVGAGICACAALLFRAYRDSDFMEQFGLALSLAGQSLMCYAVSVWFERSLAGGALVVAAQQAALFLLLPNVVHRVWAAWTAAAAFYLATLDLGWHTMAPAALSAACVWLWLREFDQASRGAVLRAGGYGLALAAVSIAVMHDGLWLMWQAIGDTASGAEGAVGAWIGAVAASAVLPWAVVMLLEREGVAIRSGPGATATLGSMILALASLAAPGLGPTTAILVLGQANGNRVLLGIGIVALLAYLSRYYYALDGTLLQKSVLLMVTGLALLLARFALHRWWPAPGVPTRA